MLAAIPFLPEQLLVFSERRSDPREQPSETGDRERTIALHMTDKVATPKTSKRVRIAQEIHSHGTQSYVKTWKKFRSARIVVKQALLYRRTAFTITASCTEQGSNRAKC